MSPPAKGRLIAFRADRLGARLVSLMNAMRLAEVLRVDLACAWIDTTGVGHVFNDPCELFDGDFVARHFLTADQWRTVRRGADKLSVRTRHRRDAIAAKLAQGRDLIVGNAFGQIGLDGETAEQVTQGFRAQFGRISFSAAVKRAMEGLGNVLTGHTAYHIRRGDLTGDPKAMNKPWPHKMVPGEFYERHMATTMAEATGGAVLFSDDSPTIAHYRRAFPALKTVSDLIDLAALTEAQRDLIELIAMSRCATIIAPRRSAFSTTAADLSGAVLCSVCDSLSTADRDAAYRALHDRLRDRPESFAGDGEIGQSLAHVGDWLAEAGRWGDAAALFSARVRAGLNISFIYPQTLGYQHRADDIDGVLATARLMSARPVVHVRDQARAEILHGYAHLRRGDRAAGLRHVANGFWHAPATPAARAIVPMLVECGWLHPGNFLPVSPVQLALQRRRGPGKLLQTDFPALAGMERLTIPKALGSLETVLWDWAPLMRSLSLRAETRRGAVGAMTERLENLPDDPAMRTERNSLAAALGAYIGAPEEAAEALQDLTAKAPDDPMTWQRLSHAWWLARRFSKAAAAAQEAAALAPGWMAMRAWAGMTLLRIREGDAAVDHLGIAARANAGLSSVHALHALSLERTGDSDQALAAIDRALALAPLEVGNAMIAARLLGRAGRARAAADRLILLVEAHRAPGKLFVQLIDILNRLGERAEAAEMSALARARTPKHPGVAILALA